MSLRQHAAWSAASALVLTGSRFVLAAVLARRLNQETFGQYAYALWLVDIGFLLFTFGATGAVSRYAAELRHSPERVAGFLRSWRPYALLLPVGAGLLAIVGAQISVFALPPMGLAALAAWTIASGLWAMQSAALTGLQRFDLVFRANAVAAVTMLGGAAIMPLSAEDPTPVMLLMAVASAVASFVGYRLVNQAASHAAAGPSPGEKRGIFAYAVNIWITAILWNLVWSRGEVPIVRAHLGDAALAQYSVALTLLGGAIAGVTLGIGGIAPQITRLLGEGREAESVSLCRKVMDVQLLACGIGSVCLILLAPELLRFGFGVDYGNAASALCILALALPTMALSLHNHLLQIVTNSRFNRNSTLAGLVFLFVTSLAFVSNFEVIGAAVARVMTLALLATLTILVFSRRFGRQALGSRNLGLVMLLTLALVALMLMWPTIGLGERLVLLALASGTLAAGIRDEHGVTVVRQLAMMRKSR